MLEHAPQVYVWTDTVNAMLVRRSLIVQTARIIDHHRREYEITDGGRAVLREQGVRATERAHGQA
jgi:hypothetical protein